MTPSCRKHATANQPASSAIKRLCNCRRTGTASCLRAVEPDPIPVTVVRSRTEVGQPAQMLWDPCATRMSFFEHSGNYVISRQMPSASLADSRRRGPHRPGVPYFAKYPGQRAGASRRETRAIPDVRKILSRCEKACLPVR